jgi:hypothetical protein
VLAACACGAAVIAVQATSARGVPGAPDAHTGGAKAVDLRTARLTGTVNPNGSETTYRFKWGEKRKYGHSTQPQSAGTGTDPVPVQADLAGLRWGHRYHYRLVAKNAEGTTMGRDRSFRTDEPRIKGKFRVHLRIKRGGGALGQHRGQKVTRNYRFAPRKCHAGRCQKLKLRRPGKRGSFSYRLKRRGIAAYGGDNSFRGWCDNGLRFDSSTRVRVRAKAAEGDLATRINGSLKVRSHGCASGLERAAFKGGAQ